MLLPSLGNSDIDVRDASSANTDTRDTFEHASNSGSGAHVESEQHVEPADNYTPVADFVVQNSPARVTDFGSPCSGACGRINALSGCTSVADVAASPSFAWRNAKCEPLLCFVSIKISAKPAATHTTAIICTVLWATNQPEPIVVFARAMYAPAGMRIVKAIVIRNACALIYAFELNGFAGVF